MYEMFAQLKTRARSPMHVSSSYAFVHVQGGRDTKNARKCNALRVQCTFWPCWIHYVYITTMATRLNRLENRTHVGSHCGGLSQKENRVLWGLKIICFQIMLKSLSLVPYVICYTKKTMKILINSLICNEWNCSYLIFYNNVFFDQSNLNLVFSGKLIHWLLYFQLKIYALSHKIS